MWLGDLVWNVEDREAEVFRVKGIVSIEDEECKFIIQVSVFILNIIVIFIDFVILFLGSS
jgi:hypothetical protein